MIKYLKVLASEKRPKIGVVFSSGGIRPFGGIELLKFLDDAKIPIDLLIGCSGGSILAAFKGLGWSNDEIQEKIDYFIQRNPEAFNKLNYHTIAGILRVPFIKYLPEEALIKPEMAKSILQEVFGDKHLEDLSIPTMIQTTNVQTGEGRMFSNGELWKIVYGSCALLPFFPPIEIDGEQYTDGGFSNALPVLDAINRDMDVIIAMDFNSPSTDKPSNAFGYFDRLINESAISAMRIQNSLAVGLHHHEVIFIQVTYPEKISMWEPHQMKHVYHRAKVAVDSMKEQILDAIESFPLTHKRERKPKNLLSKAKTFAGKYLKRLGFE